MLAAQVISAFDVPKVQYDPVRKCFFRPTASLKLLGNAQVRSLGWCLEMIDAH